MLTVVLWAIICMSIATLFRQIIGRNENLLTEAFTAIGVILVFWTFFSPWVRRCHDLGWSGLRVLFMFVPIANSILMIYMIFRKGDDSENEWGKKPSWINWD